MIPADIAFLLIAGLAFIGFVLDALFSRIRITSVLPLMLLGIALVHFGIVPSDTVAELNLLLPYISALTIAFVLFHVGLGIRFEELVAVLGRAMGFTLAVQVTTGIAIGLLAWQTFHWSLFISMIFGFALSGPSSITVPVLVRVARMRESLRTTLLFECVITDLLQLLVPLIMIQLLVSGNFSSSHIGSVFLLNLLGSLVAGVAAAIFWLWVLDRIGTIARGYYWTLTITMVLATYGASDYVGLSAAITVFVFGLMIGNRRLLTFDPLARAHPATSHRTRAVAAVRSVLRLSPDSVDIEHIQDVQREVTFFASAFFFVYIGLLFQASGLSEDVVLVPLVAAFVMLALRTVWVPLLNPYLDTDSKLRRSQRGLIAFNIPRGLAAAIVATIPLSYGLVIPHFLDAMFLAILFSTVVSTVGIFLLYSAGSSGPVADESAPDSRSDILSPTGLAGTAPPASPTDPVRPPLPRSGPGPNPPTTAPP